MIAASAILVVVAFVTLIIGIFQTGLGLIWMSIASSILAAFFLLVGVIRGRPQTTATTAAPMPGTWADEAEAPVVTTEPEWQDTSTIALEAPQPEPVEEPVRAPARTAASSRASTSRASTARSATATRPAATSRPARTPATQQSVVVIPDRDKFHKATCRYAKGAGKMTMTKSEARREGYKPCGICKP
ncbi:MAG: hypothetical protein ACYDCC_03520 [Actinomycetota bacterium]